MSLPATLSIVGATAVGALFAGQSMRSSSSDAIFDRAIKKTVDRAQAEFVQKVSLWQDHTSWSNPWQVKTAHYLVRTTHSRFLGVDIAQGLESMLEHFRNLLQTDHAPDHPWTVNIFPTLTDYNTFGGGFGHHSSFYGSFYADGDPEQPVASYWSGHEMLLRMWVTHSAAHQFIGHAFPAHAAPVWIDEGLASYFALFWDYRFGVTELARLSRAKRLLPLNVLLSSPLEAYIGSGDARCVELGMLFTYLLQFREDTRTELDEDGNVVKSPFTDYLRLMVRGQDTRANPVHALLTTELRQLEQDFLKFDFAQQ